MSDPRTLFGERRLPEFLGGRQVDRYIPPELRQGVGGLLAGVDMFNPVAAYRDYMLAARRGDYPEAGANLAGFVAPGAASMLASRLARPVVRAVRGAVSSADEGARALMETLSPVGAMDDLADQAYGEMLDQSLRAADELPVPVDPRASDLERFRQLDQDFEAYDQGMFDEEDLERINAARIELNALRERRAMGEFDDLLTEEELLRDYYTGRAFDVAGLMSFASLVEQGLSEDYANLAINRYRSLEQRFGAPDPAQAPVDIFQQEPFIINADDWPIDDETDALMNDLLADDELVPSVGGKYGYSALNPTPDANEARFYSPAQRAAGQLPQQVYGGLDEVLAALRAKGAKPEELRLAEEALYGATELGSQGSQRMFRESAQGVLRDVADDYTPYVARFTGNRTDFEHYFTKGGQNYIEVIMGAPPALRRNLNFSPPDYAAKHFDVPGGALAHYRAARFRTSGDEGEAYHVGEIQSDWGQLRSSLPKNQEDYDSTLGTLQARIRNLNAEDNLLSQKAHSRPRPSEEEMDAIVARLSAIYDEKIDAMDKLRKLEVRYNVHGTREDFDEKYADVPYIKSTNKWTQLALKQALIDAANSGSRFMTLGTGEMAKSMTGGELEGQIKYYDEVVPKNLKQILQRLASDAGIKAPEIVPRQIQVRERGATVTKTVPSIELTPELRKALSEVGLPSYRDGGLVSLLPV